MKHNRLGYLVQEGFKSVFTHGFMSFACILVIVACLLIMGSFALLSTNIDHNIDLWEQDDQTLAFVDETLSEAEARDILPRINALDNIAQVEFVTREEAMVTFINRYDEEERETFSDVTPSWFRHRYIVHLEDISRMAETTDAIGNVEGIADVQASLELSQGFVTVRNIVSIVSVILIIVLFVVSVFIMQNTIKLATFSRKEEIGIMKMVGASNMFIRWPFIIEGLILGLLGGAIAFFLQWGIYGLLVRWMQEGLFSELLEVLPFSTLRFTVLLVYLGIGLVVGTFGSNIAIRNYLKV